MIPEYIAKVDELLRRETRAEERNRRRIRENGLHGEGLRIWDHFKNGTEKFLNQRELKIVV